MPIANEDIIIKLLDAATPAEVINSKKLLHSFQRFFSKGSIHDFSQLLPGLQVLELKPADEDSQSKTEYIFQPPVGSFAFDSTGSLLQCHSTVSTPDMISNDELSSQSRPGTPDQIDSETNGLWQYFASKVKPQSRIQSLVRVANGSARAVGHSATFYENLWYANQDNFFGAQSSAESRISRLFRGRKIIDQNLQKFECAGRLSLVFLAHDIEVTKSWDWKLSPGQGRQHAAVLAIANHLSVPAEDIKKEWRRSRNYMMLLEICGPGSLLELGSGINWHWEKAMSKADVTHFIEFRKEKMPHLERRARELNLVAGQLILSGMLGYGWTMEAIARSSTRLRDALVVHCPTLFNDSMSNRQVTAPVLMVVDNYPPITSQPFECDPACSDAARNNSSFDDLFSNMNHPSRSQKTAGLSFLNSDGNVHFKELHAVISDTGSCSGNSISGSVENTLGFNENSTSSGIDSSGPAFWN